MSTTDTFLVEYDPSKPHDDSGTDWDRVNALTEEEIHAAALADPDSQPLEVLIAQAGRRW